MQTPRGPFSTVALVIALAGCSPGTTSGSETSSSVEPSEASVASASLDQAAEPFPIEAFAGLDDEPVSHELAAELQQVLAEAAKGHGVTATVISPQGTWNGATGFAAGDRATVPMRTWSGLESGRQTTPSSC